MLTWIAEYFRISKYIHSWFFYFKIFNSLDFFYKSYTVFNVGSNSVSVSFIPILIKNRLEMLKQVKLGFYFIFPVFGKFCNLPNNLMVNNLIFSSYPAYEKLQEDLQIIMS